LQIGYTLREMNASDDRSVEIFRKILDDTTQSRSEAFKGGKPNCLVIDEIDGAPVVNINQQDLMKYKS
jgi:chromosome transmission fidelity protein 18